jgi:hypothetical protein
MATTQITLNDQQTVALRSLVQRTGKTEAELIVEAVEQFLEQHVPAERKTLLRQARGMWQDRADLPDLRLLREESNRYAVPDEGLNG